MQITRLSTLFISLVIFLSGNILAQDPLWDDTSRPGWPAVFQEVGIPSSADGKTQMAYFYPTKEKQEIAGRTVHYHRQFADKIQLTIFEGGHEMLTNHALRHVP